MGKLSREDFYRATKGKTIEDLIQKIKALPTYAYYEKSVRGEGNDTSQCLQMIAMLSALMDDELGALIMTVTHDITFALIDQKLRAEILDESEGTDES